MGARTYRTVLIGAGGVATFLQRAIRAPFNVTCVGGRRRYCPIPLDAGLYIIAVIDRAVPGVAEELAGVKGLVVHTAGSVPMDALPQERRGVLYPLQTLSKQRPMDASRVPFYIEAARPADLDMLILLAEAMGTVAHPMSGEQRQYLHLAAVFCCNFVNRLYGITADMLAARDIPFAAVLPLIHETADKVDSLLPRLAQTGPAVRWDEAVMRHHLSLLTDDEQRHLYRLLSKSIHDDKLRFDQDTRPLL